jgi:hypothetical protein
VVGYLCRSTCKGPTRLQRCQQQSVQMRPVESLILPEQQSSNASSILRELTMNSCAGQNSDTKDERCNLHGGGNAKVAEVTFGDPALILVCSATDGKGRERSHISRGFCGLPAPFAEKASTRKQRWSRAKSKARRCLVAHAQLRPQVLVTSRAEVRRRLRRRLRAEVTPTRRGTVQQ